MRIKMNVALSLMLSTMLTVPLMATRTPKLPSVKIRVAVSKAIRSGEANVLANVLDEHDLHVDSVLLAGGYTVLHEAVVDGSPDIVEYLIRNDAQVNIANEYGHTPLDEATLFDKEEIVTLLEQAGATHGESFRIRAAPTAYAIRDRQTDEHTALMDAVLMGNVRSHRQNRGANIESLSNDVSPALADAAWKGDTETVALLLDRGANQNEIGLTALLLAEQNGHIEIVALLREQHGTDN